VASERSEHLHEENGRRQELRRETETQNAQYESECGKIAGEIANVRNQIEEVQQEFVERLKWQCPNCDRRNAEIKDLKKQIIAFVQQLHETEKEDTHRQYVVAHVGKSNQVLPTLSDSMTI
jgi:chromosome segregation ATPase